VRVYVCTCVCMRVRARVCQYVEDGQHCAMRMQTSVCVLRAYECICVYACVCECVCVYVL